MPAGGGQTHWTRMNDSLEPIVRFGRFELDPRTGELRRSGVRINLPEQPFQVLATLLDRAGELVTREELRQRLWQADTFVDFEHGLNAAVRRLREALGDSAEAPRFIETLPRRGYRFIAQVTRPAASEPELPPAMIASPIVPAPGDPPTARPAAGPRVVVAWTAAVAAAVVLTSGYLVWRSSARPSSPPSRQMLAVLPFENVTGDPDQEYVSDGITNELIAQLGRIDPSRLGVIARSSAMLFKRSPKRANDIGADLGVHYLVEGSVRSTGNRVRISVQLIDARNESQLWAEQYERDSQDLLALQREVGDAITRQISASLGVPSSTAVASRRHSTIDGAYQHYLRGRYHWRKENAEGLAKALFHFRQALDMDGTYAQAYSGLADTYSMMGSIGFMPMAEAYPLARAAAQKALSLDDRLAEAHNSLAGIASDYDWDWQNADRHYRRAVELNPNGEAALRFYSTYLAWMGRHEQALEFALRARDLDPVSPAAWQNVGMVHYFARRHDDAVAHFREALELDPSFGIAHVMLGRVYVATGQLDRAVEELELARTLMGPRPDVTTPYAFVLASAGRRQEALATLDELRRISEPRKPSPFRVAYVHIGLGDTNRAFDGLQQALEARDWQLGMLKVEPAFDGLRSDPRFAPLIQRVGLPQ